MSRLVGSLDLRVTPRAQQEIARLLERDAKPSWPALMLGMHVGENIGYWTVQRYLTENVDGLAELYDAKGIPLFYECRGLTFAIPQTNLLAHLEGATLDYEGNEYVLDRTRSKSDI
jgi:hypothetical protein